MLCCEYDTLGPSICHRGREEHRAHLSPYGDSKNQKVFFLQEFMSNLLSNLAENIDHSFEKSW